jgi:hypothetical protein
MIEGKSVLQDTEGLNLEDRPSELEIDRCLQDLGALPCLMQSIDQGGRKVGSGRQVDRIDTRNEFLNWVTFHTKVKQEGVTLTIGHGSERGCTQTSCSLRVL